MKKWVILGICLLLIVILSAWLRIILPYDTVFNDSETRFLTVDAYAHLRMADWSYDNFPSTMKYDAYLTYPDGAVIGARPMFSWVITALAKGTGLSVDIVAAWLPPILAILLLVPVFIIGMILFGKWAATIGCLFVAIMPGELIGRTQLGMADHDALEIFLMLLTLMFLILAMKRNWLYGIGAGITLGLYNLNWIGSPTLTLILMVYLVVQSLIDNFRRQDNTKLYKAAIIMFTLGLGGYILSSPSPNLSELTYAVVFLIAIILPAFIIGILKLARRFGLYYYLAMLVVPAIVGISIVYLIDPRLITHFVGQFIGAFVPMTSGLGMTISEMMPLLYYRGVFSLDVAWAYYGMCSMIGLGGLGWLFYKHWREPSCLLFAIWAMFTIVLTLLQRRYGYYAAVSLGMLTGYVVWIICSGVSIKQLSRQQKRRGKGSIRYEAAIISGLIMFFVVFTPVFLGGRATAKVTPYRLSCSWSDGLHWMRDNTPAIPETSGYIPEGTDALGNVPANSAYKEIGGYGVISWWDYGYWIIREGKRPAIVHPGGGKLLETSLFMLCKEDSNTYMDWYVKRFKPKYMIIDYQMVTGKFYAIPEIARSGVTTPGLMIDMQKVIRGYTNEEMKETLVMKLYYTGKFDNWEEVWQSKQQYHNHAEVKIFEYKGGL